MILSSDMIQIGRLLKPYGIKGEITLLFDKPELADIDTEYYFLEIDSIFVPFFIEEATFNSDVTLRVKFEDIDDEVFASKFSKLPVFLHREMVENVISQENYDWDFFIGYTIVAQNNTIIGVVDAVDSATINVLFVVVNGDEEHLIPATEDFIVSIDEKTKTIWMNLPDGLIE